jgi:hypothetical protein
MANDISLKFEKIQADICLDLYRTEVPGGWLVATIDDVLKYPSMNGGQCGTGYEWRAGICFVPDSEHLWE